MSYYLREIPNKPPPPYTPPGAVNLYSSFNDSPSPPPLIVPISIEELTAITDKMIAFIYEAKQTGAHVPSLTAPIEIYDLGKKEEIIRSSSSNSNSSSSSNSSISENETLKKDRQTYNIFLFDLCKEVIIEMYPAEFEETKPSWMKVNTRSKVNSRFARSFKELNERVVEEIALLMGFKTKPQRENLIMRWSKKRRDRLDELLAKEAQQEEKEWTNYDLDGLTFKNDLTTDILNVLVAETTKCIKFAYAKKRRLAEESDVNAR